jgi:hypothetical protein
MGQETCDLICKLQRRSWLQRNLLDRAPDGKDGESIRHPLKAFPWRRSVARQTRITLSIKAIRWRSSFPASEIPEGEYPARVASTGSKNSWQVRVLKRIGVEKNNVFKNFLLPWVRREASLSSKRICSPHCSGEKTLSLPGEDSGCVCCLFKSVGQHSR